MTSNKKRLLIVMLLLLALILPGLDQRLKVVHYAVNAEGLTNPVRIALVTDLHSCAYGPGQRTLIDALDAEAPDGVMLVGDIFDDKLSDDNTETFLAGIAGRYPCWYVTGNHEYWSGAAAFDRKMAILEKLNIPRLENEAVEVELNGQRVTLCGVDDPRAWSNDATVYAAKLRELARTESYAILLAHRPEYAEMYAECGFDLVLSGHAHGGQWRVPGLLNGLFAPNQGLFPKYAGGVYQIEDTTMVVSRGLARESTRVPRFYNRPELVIVELNKNGVS